MVACNFLPLSPPFSRFFAIPTTIQANGGDIMGSVRPWNAATYNWGRARLTTRTPAPRTPLSLHNDAFLPPGTQLNRRTLRLVFCTASKQYINAATSGNRFWGFDSSAPMALFYGGSVSKRLAAFCPTDGLVRTVSVSLRQSAELLGPSWNSLPVAILLPLLRLHTRARSTFALHPVRFRFTICCCLDIIL